MLHQRELSFLKNVEQELLPDISTLPPQEQDKLRAHKERDLSRAVCEWFYKTNFNYNYKPTSILDPDTNEPSLSAEQSSRLNTMILLLNGIGENPFMLNECMAKNEHIVNYKTLANYDKAFHYQQEQYQIDDPNFKTKTEVSDYRIRLYSNWARIIFNRNDPSTFRYITLNSAAAHVFQNIDNYSLELIEELIPYSYEDGPDHGKETEDGYFRWNMVANAHGLEDELKALQKHARELLKHIHDELINEFEILSWDCIWTIPNEDIPCDKTIEYVFSDSQALNVRFAHWAADTKQKQTRDIKELHNITEHYRSSFECELRNLASKILRKP